MPPPRISNYLKISTKFNKNFSGFTLAEVLITLGIIGVVAAITLPVITENVQKIVLKNQFKKAYANFQNAIFQSQANLGGSVGCYYPLDTSNRCDSVCTDYDPTYNTCIKWACADGSPLPSNWNGLREDCIQFYDNLFNKVLKVIKYCPKNALANGCLTERYRGTDKAKAENNPNAQYPPDPNADFSDSNIKNKYSAWILSDSTLIIKYGGETTTTPVFTIDINGHKGPNKWGYDLFSFIILGDDNTIKKIDGRSYATEKGGKTTAEMIIEQ